MVLSLDVWLQLTRILPWKGPVVMMMDNTLKELPSAEPKIVLFTSLSAFMHEIDGEIKHYLGGRAKIALNLGLVGPPGTGKSTIAYHIFSKLDNNIIGSRSSPEGLARELADTGKLVHIADEVHQIFKGRKREDYVGALIDLWKTAFIKVPLKFVRRNSSNSIVVPEDAKLTVIWTTTFDDLEKVSDVFDPALIRRFLILTTSKEIEPWDVGQEADWDIPKAMVGVVRENKWVFIPRIDDSMKTLRNRLATLFIDHKIAKIMLSEYAIRIGCALALDRLLASIMLEVGEEIKTSLNPGDMMKSMIKQRLQQIALNNTNNDGNGGSLSSGLSKKSPPLSNGITRVSKVSKEFSNSSENVIQIAWSRLHSMSKYVETINSIYNDIVEGVSTSADVAVEILSSKIIDALKYAPWEQPVVHFDPSTSKFVVEVPETYVLFGLFLAALAMIDSMKVVAWLGYDPNWAYFVRRLMELKQRFPLVTLRDLSRYMKRVGKYSVLMDYVRRAMSAGYLDIHDGEPDDLRRATLEITIEPLTRE